MKKIIYTLLVVFLANGFVSAQSIDVRDFNLRVNKNLKKKASILLDTKVALIDTVYFNLARLSNVDSAKFLGLYTPGSAKGMGQYFECPQPMQVLGASFFAATYPLPVVNCTIAIYNATADSLPSGTELSSVIVQVDSSTWDGSIEFFANFSAPVNVTGPYIITLENATANRIYVLSTNYKTNDGLGEGYAVAKLSTAWLHANEIPVGGYTYDADFLINPRVSYTLASPTYTFSPNCLVNNTDVTFTLNAPAMYTNKMYNYWANVDSAYNQFAWDYGDSDFDMYVMNPSHNYVTAANYLTKLYYYFEGWSFGTDIDSVSQNIDICTGVDENSGGSIVIYPNPASHYIVIENASSALVEIYNIYGSLILQKQNDNNVSSIDVSSLPEGNYIVKITNDKTILTRKVFIER